MDDPTKWTDVWQARASVFTAVFTALSVILVFIYTILTNKALRVARKATREGLRPVLILLRVDRTATHCLATFRNAGEGVALSLEVITGTGRQIDITSNVLAPEGELLIDFPSTDLEGVIDVAYQSVETRAFRTVSSYSSLGKVFNKYLPDSKLLKPLELADIHKAMLKRALLSDAHGYLAQTTIPESGALPPPPTV